MRLDCIVYFTGASGRFPQSERSGQVPNLLNGSLRSCRPRPNRHPPARMLRVGTFSQQRRRNLHFAVAAWPIKAARPSHRPSARLSGWLPAIRSDSKFNAKAFRHVRNRYNCWIIPTETFIPSLSRALQSQTTTMLGKVFDKGTYFGP